MSSESLDEMARALVDEMITNTHNRLLIVQCRGNENRHHHHHHTHCDYLCHHHCHHDVHNRGVRDVIFCESFLDYVQRHPLLQRAIISRYDDDQDDVSDHDDVDES